MDDLVSIEKEKYKNIKKENNSYGHSFHAKNHLDFFKDRGIKSLCDIGSGGGQFCNWVRCNICDEVYGTDISFENFKKEDYPDVKWIEIEAEGLGTVFDEKSIDIITAFDVLEHIVPEHIDVVLNNIKNISKIGFIGTIATNEYYFLGEKVHMTVNPIKWWIHELSRYFDISHYSIDKHGVLFVDCINYTFDKKHA